MPAGVLGTLLLYSSAKHFVVIQMKITAEFCLPNMRKRSNMMSVLDRICLYQLEKWHI